MRSVPPPVTMSDLRLFVLVNEPDIVLRGLQLSKDCFPRVRKEHNGTPRVAGCFVEDFKVTHFLLVLTAEPM